MIISVVEIHNEKLAVVEQASVPISSAQEALELLMRRRFSCSDNFFLNL